MGTTTPRLGLYKSAAVGEQVNVETQINAAYDKIDDAIGAKQVTSGTLPSVPYEGQIIHETDTNKTKLRVDAAWKLIAEDTDWVNIPLEADATVVDGMTPQYRRINGVVYCRGRVNQPGSYILVPDAGFKPARDGERWATTTGNSGSTAGVIVWGASVGKFFTVAGTTVNLNNLIYIAES